MSIGTVDRALHNRGRVSKATEDKVRRIIEELDYRPNIFAKKLKLDKTFTFGVLMPKPSQDSMCWTLPVNGIDRAHEELAGQKGAATYFFYGKYSEASFQATKDVVLEACCDGLLIAPVLSRVFHGFIKEIPKETPYVFFDSFIPEASPLSTIGQDSFQSGVLSGKLMHMLVREKASVAVIRVLPHDYHIDDRVSGFMTYCEACPDIEARVFEVEGEAAPEDRNRVFEDIFARDHDLRGIFVTNASTHMAAEFIHQRSLEKKIHIIGYDLIEKNVAFLKSGVIDFLISQQSERQGYEGLYALYRHVVLKRPVPKKIFMQLDIVTRENVDYYKS